MEEFDIHTYLDNYNNETRRGICKSCLKSVIWKRERVCSHKRVNCDAATAEEKLFFSSKDYKNPSKRAREHAFEDISNDSVEAIQTPRASEDQKDTAFGNIFYRTGISFRIADSEAMKKFVIALDPEYSKKIPSSKSLSSRLLNRQYDETRAVVDDILRDADKLTLLTDGWTNVRGEHLVNFIVKAPGKDPFFYKAVNTSGVRQDATEIAETICNFGRIRSR